jgi:GNAT superfamily N-acetyltransferase
MAERPNLRREANPDKPTMQNKVFMMIGDNIASKVEFDIDLCKIAWVKTYDGYRNRGFATMVFSDALDWIKSSGKCSRVSLTIAPQENTDYDKLLKFYSRFNFQPASITDRIKTIRRQPCELSLRFDDIPIHCYTHMLICLYIVIPIY